MRFLIITHVEHKEENNTFSAYAPYVREMNLWLKHVSEVIIVAPQSDKSKSVIDLAYLHDNISFNLVASIKFTSIKSAIFSIIKIPSILINIFKACKKADHIHLRCPGNIGLLGCLVQVFFPNKIKTAKYAGNWNPAAVQPKSYKFQKWLLSNTFLTKNMTALVYGEWKNQTKNIKAFFTASFSNQEKRVSEIRDYSTNLKFVFLGSLVNGKRPLLAIQIVEALINQGVNIDFDIYGEGILKPDLQNYIVDNNLEGKVRLLGNRNQSEIKQALKESHFLILPSKSEGWPKAVAEAMFFGVVPIVTEISCVPFMLDFGKRGILIPPNKEKAFSIIWESLKDTKNLKIMSNSASEWSQKYTLDVFETEIKKILKH
ncbi:glycosyltransferase [uncultured Algibacter sp.]|uniref:glycosyltransferase family 4 protein n=1 Tax=uncultured Algibacter sp. TaxID=298659 RepID=UPI00260B7023|nr:glycosyltransferase [uncultured Algibacter sp.]